MIMINKLDNIIEFCIVELISLLQKQCNLAGESRLTYNQAFLL